MERIAYNARMDEYKPRRPWLSFGIRDLLWAMVVVAIFFAWIREQEIDVATQGENEFELRGCQKRNEMLSQAISRAGYTVDYDDVGPYLRK